MTSSSAIAVLTLALVISSICQVESLQSNFYRNSCPQAEAAISSIVASAVRSNPRIGAGLIRLLFHDCFVQGCDASVLIDKSSRNAEKNAGPNLTLRGLNVIDQVKAVVESLCPKTVSCADIVAFSAATSLSTLGGPTVDMQGGRFDGLVSSDTEASNQLPSQFDSLSTLQGRFGSKGLSTSDLVTLSGAHTVGQAHCSSFSGRLRNFSSSSSVDPSLDPTLAATLQGQCPVRVSSSKVVNMDPPTPNAFENGYHRLLQGNRGLFSSDAALMTSSSTRRIVNGYASNNPAFVQNFAAAFFKLGSVGLKTRQNGNIRTNCHSFT